MMIKYTVWHIALTVSFAFVFSSCTHNAASDNNPQSLFNSPDCVTTCWRSIEVGRSTEADLQRVLDNLKIVYGSNRISPDPTEFNYYWDDVIGRYNVQASIIVDEGIVGRFQLYGQMWCITTILAIFGENAEIYEEGESYYLIYPSAGIMFRTSPNEVQYSRINIVDLVADSNSLLNNYVLELERVPISEFNELVEDGCVD